MNDVTTELELTPEIRSKPIQIVATAMEPIVIPHELGRVPAGWLLIDTTAPVLIWRSGVMNSNKLELTADQDANIVLVLL